MKILSKSLTVALASSLMCSAVFAAEIEENQNTVPSVSEEIINQDDENTEKENKDVENNGEAAENPDENEHKIIFDALSPEEISQSKNFFLRDPFYVEPPAPPQNNDEFDYDIASYSTKYSTSSGNYNRNYNMQLAAEAINGVVLQPGDSFSYNDTILSKSNGGKGYLSAGILVNGRPSTGRGGGICQVSSTLFQAALYSGMTITSRTSHSSKVGYLPAGRDATVSWGSVDFKFRNDLSIPVKIQAYANEGEILVRFWSQEKPPSFNEIEVTVKHNGRSYVIYRYIDGYCDYSSASRYS